MKTHIIPGIIILIGIPLFLTGCITVKDTVYLESLSVEGPVQPPPIHITTEPHAGQFTITPKISSANAQTFDGHAIPLAFPGDTFTVAGTNFEWKIPSTQVGLDFDWLVSDGFALTGGFIISSGGGKSYTGGNIGIGLPFRGESLSGRFDAGLQFQQIDYDAYSALVHDVSTIFSGTDRTVTYFHDLGSSTPTSFYATLTLNSHSSSPVNFFGNFAYTHQNLVSFSPRRLFAAIPPVVLYEYTDARTDFSSSFLMFTPGVTISVSPSVRVLVGVRFMKEVSFSNDGLTLTEPTVQWDFTL